MQIGHLSNARWRHVQRHRHNYCNILQPLSFCSFLSSADPAGQVSSNSGNRSLRCRHHCPYQQNTIIHIGIILLSILAMLLAQYHLHIGIILLSILAQYHYTHWYNTIVHTILLIFCRFSPLNFLFCWLSFTISFVNANCDGNSESVWLVERLPIGQI